MIFKVCVLLSLFTISLYAQSSLRIENTNFTLSQGSYVPTQQKRYLYNYNRLRLYYDWDKGDYFMHTSGDIVNYFGKKFIDSNSFSYLRQLHADTPIKMQSHFHHYGKGDINTKLYRLYGGYQDDNNRLVAGLQNITMGVGHIWTPSNLFNPQNSYALEPDETFGVMALSYTRYIGTQSQIYGVLSQRKDKSRKYAAGYKTTLNMIDIALNTIHSNDTNMFAYAIEGDLGDTGIDVRSEGAYIKSRIAMSSGREEEKKFFQGLVGADYAFEHGLNLTIETLYSSETFGYDDLLANFNKELFANLAMAHWHLGTTLSYDFTIYLSGSLLYIESLHSEDSRFISPSLRYILNDNNTFSIGAMLYGGSQKSEFGMQKNSYYLKYVLSY